MLAFCTGWLSPWVTAGKDSRQPIGRAPCCNAAPQPIGYLIAWKSVCCKVPSTWGVTVGPLDPPNHRFLVSAFRSSLCPRLFRAHLDPLSVVPRGSRESSEQPACAALSPCTTQPTAEALWALCALGGCHSFWEHLLFVVVCSKLYQFRELTLDRVNL